MQSHPCLSAGLSGPEVSQDEGQVDVGRAGTIDVNAPPNDSPLDTFQCIFHTLEHKRIGLVEGRQANAIRCQVVEDGAGDDVGDGVKNSVV